jgi:hypothetical protein
VQRSRELLDEVMAMLLRAVTSPVLAKVSFFASSRVNPFWFRDQT